MSTSKHASTVTKRGAEDSGQYFKYMAEFIGFTAADAQVVRQTKPIIEKHLPDIVTQFYAHLLRYPATRKFFLKQDGSIDQEYVELRMRHLTNFWLRTADAVFDDDYARYLDYVGRAHTSRGADPKIYISERYVIGQVGMVQHAITEVLSRELRSQDLELEFRAVEAWDKLMIVILEILSRAYSEDKELAASEPLAAVDQQMVARLALAAFAREQGEGKPVPTRRIAVAEAAGIPDGTREIVQVAGLSIGVFHHRRQWYALHSSCVHRGGPVATGVLNDDILTCPWHGFQYNVTNGQCLADPSARLDVYPVTVQDGKVYLLIPDLAATPAVDTQAAPSQAEALKPNEFRVAEMPSGRIMKVQVNGADVAVYNVGGAFYATQNDCTHAGGALSDGDLAGTCVTCPIHGSRFDVVTGQVVEDPADEPLKLYRVTVDGALGRVTETTNT